MLTIRKSSSRGFNEFSWLKSYHSFSFGSYYDPKFTQFSVMRVLNDDVVAESGGFAPHSHKDMEIVSYVLSGALEHKDSLGTGSVIKYGDVQAMSAGTGITHSEYNHSSTEIVHFLQIWFFPNEKNLKPRYAQKHFSKDEKLGKFTLVVSGNEKDDVVFIHQDVKMYSCILNESFSSANLSISKNRKVYVHIAKGSCSLNGLSLTEGDGVFVEHEESLSFVYAQSAEGKCEVIVIDLP